jgi:hypothetical protein
MNKPFLLTAGANYYPCRGTGDWIGCFETAEEAQQKYAELFKEDEYSHEWHEIIDLRDWTE